MRPRQRRYAAAIAAGAATVALAATVIVALTDSAGWSPLVELWLARGSGWSALGALLLALIATPVGRVIARARPKARAARWVGPLRRAFGITSAILALAHAGVALFGYLASAWDAVLTWPYLRAGLVALLVLSALLLTSFPQVLRRLRIRAWKPLHRLAYVAAALALVHLMLSPFAPRVLTLGVFAALLVVALGRLLPTRAARKAIESVDPPP